MSKAPELSFSIPSKKYIPGNIYLFDGDDMFEYINTLCRNEMEPQKGSLKLFIYSNSINIDSIFEQCYCLFKK